MPATSQDPGGCNCGEAIVPCDPCFIPRRDLHTTYGAGYTLHYDPTYLVGHGPGIMWHSDCFASRSTANGRFVFGCNADGTIVLALEEFFVPGEPPTPAPCTPDFPAVPGHAQFVYALIPVDPLFSCDPLILPFAVDSDTGVGEFYVSDPGGGGAAASIAPTPEDLALRDDVARHGCGGCGS